MKTILEDIELSSIIRLKEVNATDYIAFINKEISRRHNNRDLDTDTDMMLRITPYDKLPDTHERSRRYYFIRTVEGMAGYIVLLRNKMSFLDGLYILPEFRRRKIATQAVQLSGVTECMVKSHNNEAIQLYRSLGFEIVQKSEADKYGTQVDYRSHVLFKYQIMRKT